MYKKVELAPLPPLNFELAKRIRNAIEGKFGQGKPRLGLNRVMAKLDNTSGTVIGITFFGNEPGYLVAPDFLCVFMSICQKNTCFWVEDNLQV